jgi:hypothetical protein
VEGHRAAWLTLAAVLLAAALGTPVTVWTVTALNPHVAVPLWLFTLPFVLGALGLYVLGAVAWDWPLPARPAPTGAPVGGGIPLKAPIEYQVRALRQIVGKIGERYEEFDHLMLDEVMKNHPRKRMDPVYEPLQAMTVFEGLAELVRRGELIDLGHWHWRIPARGAGRRFPRSSKRGQQPQPPSQGSGDAG